MDQMQIRSGSHFGCIEKGYCCADHLCWADYGHRPALTCRILIIAFCASCWKAPWKQLRCLSGCFLCSTVHHRSLGWSTFEWYGKKTPVTGLFSPSHIFLTNAKHPLNRTPLRLEWLSSHSIQSPTETSRTAGVKDSTAGRCLGNIW